MQGRAAAGQLHVDACAAHAGSLRMRRSSLHMTQAPLVLCRVGPLPATYMSTPLLYWRHRR